MGKWRNDLGVGAEIMKCIRRVYIRQRLKGCTFLVYRAPLVNISSVAQSVRC